mgnify:FL=1
MRDDLHKDAPVSREWKDALYVAHRDAESPAVRSKYVERAVVAQVRGGLDEELLDAVRKTVAPRQHTLRTREQQLKAVNDLQSQHRPGPMGALFIDCLRDALYGGLHAEKALHSAACRFFDTVLDRQLRNIGPWVFRESEIDEIAVLDALRTAPLDPMRDEIAETLASGSLPDRRPKPKPDLDVDADLRRGFLDE